MIVQTIRGMLTVALLVVLPTTNTRAAEPRDEVPKDPDFLVQGEYVGEVPKPDGKKRIGVQVIALGKGMFHAMWREGGLPGDGWDKTEATPYDGETVEGVTTFKVGEYTAKIKDGVMVVTAQGNVVVGELKRIVRKSPTLGDKPPKGAVVLFDGKNADQFENGRMTDDGLLKQGATSKFKHQSGTLHIEFQIPYGPLVPSRGNSGCYLQSRYEVQMLDSFGLKPHNHECGGIPSIKEPDINMSFPPLSWQTYDVDFTAAQFANGEKTKNARMTVRHNGVVVHDNVELPHATTSSPLPEGPELGPINLQDHQAEVRYRNIWFVEK
ncbi:MAG: DUF1080 domain-containing protein [Planctomycetales bacterium]|nr:DUF1080 domain-containing protein [Planctomycetales bacterium]